jgi:hypothetical protein
MVLNRLDEAVFADETTKGRIVQELASHPEEALGIMIDILGRAPKSRWRLATRVIRAIGSPKNISAIPRLIEQVADSNSPARDEAARTLAEMDPGVVVPYFILFLLDSTRHYSWESDIEGFCSMLSSMELAYIVPCGPTITHLLSYFSRRNDFRGKLDLGFLLDLLEKIGPSCAEYALPTLIGLINQGENSHVSLQARRLIATFSQEAREPYKHLLASLGISTAEGQPEAEGL